MREERDSLHNPLADRAHAAETLADAEAILERGYAGWPTVEDGVAFKRGEPTPGMQRVAVRAAQLRPGDLLLGSGMTVTSAPERGIYTPAGSVELAVSYPKHPGELHRKTWRAGTSMTILRRMEPST